MKLQEAGSPPWRIIMVWSLENRDDMPIKLSKIRHSSPKDQRNLSKSNHLCCVILDLMTLTCCSSVLTSFIDFLSSTQEDLFQLARHTIIIFIIYNNIISIAIKHNKHQINITESFNLQNQPRIVYSCHVYWSSCDCKSMKHVQIEEQRSSITGITGRPRKNE